MRVAVVALWSALLAACTDATMVATPPQPPPPPPTSITVFYCAPFAPVWVAFQDGDGPWTRAQPVVAIGTTAFSYGFSANRGAIATVRQAGPAITLLQVLYGAPEELATESVNTPRLCSVPGTKLLSGTVAGLDTNESASIAASLSSFAAALANESFALAGVDGGLVDLLATRSTRTDDQTVLSRVILRRAIAVPDGTTLPVLDFSSPEAFPPATAQVTLDGIGSDIAFVATRIQTLRLESGLSNPSGAVAGAVQPYFAVPEARLLPGDVQVLSATTNTGTGSLRTAAIYFRVPQDLTVSLGPEALPPTFSILARDPVLRIRAQFAEQSAYDRTASVSYQDEGRTPASPIRFVTVSMTSSYRVPGAEGYDIVVPDLSGADGFNPQWGLSGGSFVQWSANRVGGTVGLGIDPVATEGAVQRTATIIGVLTP